MGKAMVNYELINETENNSINAIGMCALHQLRNVTNSFFEIDLNRHLDLSIIIFFVRCDQNILSIRKVVLLFEMSGINGEHAIPLYGYFCTTDLEFHWRNVIRSKRFCPHIDSIQWTFSNNFPKKKKNIIKNIDDITNEAQPDELIPIDKQFYIEHVENAANIKP